MGFFDKLKSGLQKTKNTFIHSADSIFRSLSGEIGDDFYDELEEILILADVGIETSEEIIDELRDRIRDERIMDGASAKEALRRILKEKVTFENRELNLSTKPSVILVIGVNGVGKTTSIAKIAYHLKSEGKKVLIAAADTFRAAAIDQLEVWADRIGVDLAHQSEGSDPAAVVFDAAAMARSRASDVLIIDTAGRLHNKKNLMNELSKIRRVVDRELPGSALEVLLVLDATTGQNAVNQAKEFKETAGLTGIVLTKLDGTAKGGIIFSIKNELDLPVKYIGVGEAKDDLQPFDPNEFVDALFDGE